MSNLILAIDFDGCIVEAAWPQIGSLRPNAKKILQQLHKDGHYIIIWTCRSGMDKSKAEQFLLDNGIPYDKVNEQHPKNIVEFGGDTRKVLADVYIDDRQVGGIPSWNKIYKLVTMLSKYQSNKHKHNELANL